MTIPRRGRPPQRFRLQRIRLVGFHNFIDETVEIRDGGHLFLLGDNGSGKTTVLDAVQYALSGGHDLELNAAARVGGRKDDGRTIQGVVLRYDAERGVRNTQGGIAYAVLELVDEDGTALCLGVGTEAQTLDARVNRWGVLIRASLEQLPLVRQDRTVVAREELRERLGKEHVFGRVEDYRRAVADRLFGGPELYEEVCRFWGMAKAYREIVAGARDFGALFARLLPAPDPQVFGDILARLREIDGLEVNLREIDQQRLYVAGLVGLEDAVAQQREAGARYAWLLAARRREDAELERARSRARAVELEAALAAAELAEAEAAALLRVAEEERHTAEAAEGARLEAALREAEARADAAVARARSARQDAASAQADEQRAGAAAVQARAELAALLERVAADLARSVQALEAPGATAAQAGAGAATSLPALRAHAAQLAQAAAEVAQAEPGAAPLPVPTAEHTGELEDAVASARVRRDAALHVSSCARAQVDAARAQLAELATLTEEAPRLHGWAGLRAALAAEGLAAQPLYELLEPKPGASDAALAAIEALAGEAGLAMLLAPAPDLERVRALAATRAPAAHVHIATAADARLPAWIDDALAPGAAAARAALATWLSQAASLGEPLAPAGATLRHRGAAFEVTDARPRLLGQMARAAALRARLVAAQAALAAAEQEAARATVALGATDVALARLDRVAEALRAASGATLATAHATTLAAAHTAARCRALGLHAAARHDEAAQEAERTATLLAALRARLDEQAVAELRAQLAALARACAAARARQRDAIERVVSLRNELQAVRLAEEAQVRGLAERAAAQAAAGGVLRARLLTAVDAGDDALSVYVRETRQGNRFRSTAAVEDALRAAERDEHGSATELAGDGSRGVRNAAYAPRFGFAYDRAANQVLGRQDQPARTVLAGIDRDLAEQREVINSRTRELMDTLVMGSLARHLQEQIERLARMVREMNQLLAGIPFGAGTYEFQVTARADRREAVELVRQVSLVDEESRRRFRTWIDERLPDLRAGEAEVPEILDYRRWFDYRLFVRSAGQDGVELTAERRRVGSGGEQGVPNYLLVLALGKLMFDNADARIRPLMFDEAFYGIDAGRRDQLLRFATELGIQLLVASPDQDGVTPAVRHATTLFVVKDAHGDVHLAPYHFWNHAGAAQRGLFGDSDPAAAPAPEDAECRIAPTPVPVPVPGDVGENSAAT